MGLASSLAALHGGTQQEHCHLETRNRALIRTRLCGHPDLGLARLQNCKENISVV